MKNKKTNKIIILSFIGVVLFVSFLIFILNYSKDDSSFSILEKKWIKNNNDQIIDVSIYNDVPLYGMNGEGIAFSFLDSFTKDYGISFNKISYFVNTPNEYKDVSFKILNYDDALSSNDILMYEDSYVILSKKTKVFDSPSDIKGITIGVLDKDMESISTYLYGSSNTSYLPYNSLDSMLEAYELNAIDYFAVPLNLYLNSILENENTNIVYHISEMQKKYVLTVNNKDLYNILSKYYNYFMKEYFYDIYKTNFTKLFFTFNHISEQEQASYNSHTYIYGLLNNMPYESIDNSIYVGILSNYLKEFSSLVDVEFSFAKYDSVSSLKKALSSGDVDVAYGNFNLDNLKVDIISTLSPMKEEYVVLSNQDFLVNSVKSLQNKEVVTIKDTKLYDYLTKNNVKVTSYNNMEELLRSIGTDKILVLDKGNYEYYASKRFHSYNVLYTGTIDEEYTFVIRDVNQNTTFSKLFSYYVSSVNYNAIKFHYNNDFDINTPGGLYRALKYIFIVLVILCIVVFGSIIFSKRRKKEKTIKKDEKMRFIDMLTSLKNRNYLNYNISKWDDNVIYPQAIILIDLNNIKYINDNFGHEEGDNVIKRAASILIVNQLENSDIIRTDGNEFLIYMVGYDEKQVVAYTRKIYKELKELPHGFGSAIGYSMIYDEIKTIDDAINEAALEMRSLKEKQHEE